MADIKGKLPLVFEIENFEADGKNNIRLFRGEKIEGATVTYVRPAANFDDFERLQNGCATSEFVPLSIINDFIKSGLYVLIDVKVEAVDPEILRWQPEKKLVDGRVVDIPERPVIYLHNWEPLSNGEGFPIYLNLDSGNWFAENMEEHLSVKTQVGIQFVKPGKIKMYLYVVSVIDYEDYLSDVRETEKASYFKP